MMMIMMVMIVMMMPSMVIVMIIWFSYLGSQPMVIRAYSWFYTVNGDFEEGVTTLPH